MARFIAAVLMAASFVYAQNVTVSTGPRNGSQTSSAGTPSLSTVTFEDCSNGASETITSTGTITKTYCSECEMSATALNENAAHTTVYTTVYSMTCPTGLTAVTYTVTESCTRATPTFSSGTGYIPGGFTTSMVTCSVCGPTPITAMMTFPTSATPVAMPLATSSSVPQSPCPGPGCEATGTSMPVAPTSPPSAVPTLANVTNITPFTGGVSSNPVLGALWLSIAGITALLALAL